MDTYAKVSTYRGHEIVVTRYTPNGSADSYYTEANDCTGTLLADEATDETEDQASTAAAEGKDQPTIGTVRTYATAEAARKAAEHDIEEILGAAEDEEIAEAAYDLSNSQDGGQARRNAKRLADAIHSQRDFERSDKNDAYTLGAILNGIADAAKHAGTE